MKNAKKIFGTFILVLFTSTAMFAQTDEAAKKKKTPQERAIHMAEKMTEHLALNAEQAKQVEAANLELANEMAAIKKEMEALRERKKAARDRFDGKMDSILDDEQRAKYKEWKEKKKAEHGERKKQHQRKDHR